MKYLFLLFFALGTLSVNAMDITIINEDFDDAAFQLLYSDPPEEGEEFFIRIKGQDIALPAVGESVIVNDVDLEDLKNAKFMLRDPLYLIGSVLSSLIEKNAQNDEIIRSYRSGDSLSVVMLVSNSGGIVPRGRLQLRKSLANLSAQVIKENQDSYEGLEDLPFDVQDQIDGAS